MSCLYLIEVNIIASSYLFAGSINRVNLSDHRLLVKKLSKSVLAVFGNVIVVYGLT